MANSEHTETALENLPTIPLGVSDWGSLQDGNYLVVDKDDADEPDAPEQRKFNCAITNKDVAKEFVPVLKQYLQELELR